MSPLAEGPQRAAFLTIATLHLALGGWMVASPHSFFTSLGAFAPYNAHYERDAATFILAFAFGSAVAVGRPGWRVPILAVITVQYALHALNHLHDAGRAANSWAGPVDVVTLALAGAQFAALLWLLGRPSGARA